jgi:hypothetical protein
LPDTAAFADHIRAPFERKTLNGSATAALNGLGSRLKDVYFAVGSVLAPFNIHRALIVVFDRDSHLGKLDDLLLAERETMRVRFVHVHRFDCLARPRIIAVDHLDGFAAKGLTK